MAFLMAMTKYLTVSLRKDFAEGTAHHGVEGVTGGTVKYQVSLPLSLLRKEESGECWYLAGFLLCLFHSIWNPSP